MIWALEQISKCIDIVWEWIERLLNWRPCPKQRTYEDRVPLFDLNAPFGTRDFGIISGNYEGKNFFEYRNLLLEMQENLYETNGREPLGENGKELLYICRRVEKWSDCSKIIDAFFTRKNMKECRLLFLEYEYHPSEQNKVTSIMAFILSHSAWFTERQKMLFALVDYNFIERRVFIPEEQELYNQLKDCRTTEETNRLLYIYQTINQNWYDYIRTVDVSTQELMNRARANFFTERNRYRSREPIHLSTKLNKKNVDLEDVIKRLDEIERFIGFKTKNENHTEKGEIVLE